MRWAETFKAAFLADAAIVAIVTTRVYTRRIRQGKGARDMGEAFDADGRIRTSLYINGGTVTEDFTSPDALLHYPTVWIHAPDTDQGWADVDQLVQRIRAIVPTIQAPPGTELGGVEWQPVDELGTTEDETWPDSIVNYVRVTDSLLWRTPV